MFNEKSEIWIKIFRYYTVFIFGLEAICAAVLGICGLTETICITDLVLIDALFLAFCGYLVTFVHLVTNMLTVQFLNNVNEIRQSLAN